MTKGIRWDAHSCVPLNPSYRLDQLERHHACGFRFVSINVGMDVTPVRDTMQMLASFRQQVEQHPKLTLADTIDDVDHAARHDRLAVAFDLEGAVPLLQNPDMVGLYHKLGVRQMHFAYNRANEAAGGCYDPDAGLTALGEMLVARCEDVGVIVDCSHLNERTSLEIMQIARKPVVFSHSNCRALEPDLRNITDAMIDACAASGGAIGVNGMSKLLPPGKRNVEGMADQIDHVVQRVGVAHVGVGLDYVYDQDQDELPPGIDPAFWFPVEHGYDENYYRGLCFVTPEEVAKLGELLSKRGYGADDIALIWGGNFLRVARACWNDMGSP